MNFIGGTLKLFIKCYDYSLNYLKTNALITYANSSYVLMILTFLWFMMYSDPSGVIPYGIVLGTGALAFAMYDGPGLNPIAYTKKSWFLFVLTLAIICWGLDYQSNRPDVIERGKQYKEELKLKELQNGQKLESPKTS